jgi:hypothetical protein
MFAALRALLFLFGSLTDKAGGMWDPNGLAARTDDKAGSQWDPNG